MDGNVYASEPYWQRLKYSPFVDDPICQGRVFAGWYTAECNGQRIQSGDDVVERHDRLYARFVELNPCGGRLSGGDVSGNVLPEATKPGYVFGGWYTEERGGTRIETILNYQIFSNCVLYAHWQSPIKYSVVLDIGDGSSVVSFGDVEYDEAFVPVSPGWSKPAHRLDGWTTADGSILYSIGAAVSNLTTTAGEEVALCAVWRVAELAVNSFRQRYPWNGLVDVVFTINGDPCGEYPIMIEAMDRIGATNLLVRTLLSHDEEVIGNPFVAQSGRHRVVWDAGMDLPDGFKCEDVAVRLHHAISVEFDAVGGTCEEQRRYYVLNRPYTTLPTPRKSGCVFLGWYKDLTYVEEVKAGTIVLPSVKYLHARWEDRK